MEIKQNDCINLLKFIMAIFVVGIHTQFLDDKIYPIARIAVPIFFVLSSYFFFTKISGKSYKDQKKILIKTVKRNLQLYMFWFIFLCPITIYVRKYFFHGILEGFLSLSHDFFFSSTFLASWYIVAMIIGLVIVFMLSKFICNELIICIAFLCYLLACVSSNYHFLIEGYRNLGNVFNLIVIIFDQPSNNFFVSLIWIEIGKLIAEKNLNISRKCTYICGAISIIVLYCEYFLILNFQKGNYINDCYLMLIPVTIFIVIAILKINCCFSKSYVLRKVSTIVYCSHFSVAVVIDNLIEYIGVNNRYHWCTFIITIFIVLGISYIILKLEKKKIFRFLRYSH